MDVPNYIISGNEAAQKNIVYKLLLVIKLGYSIIKYKKTDKRSLV